MVWYQEKSYILKYLELMQQLKYLWRLNNEIFTKYVIISYREVVIYGKGDKYVRFASGD